MDIDVEISFSKYDIILRNFIGTFKTILSGRFEK